MTTKTSSDDQSRALAESFGDYVSSAPYIGERPATDETDHALDLVAIRKRADHFESTHECIYFPVLTEWCDREPCETMQTVNQLRDMAAEIERLRGLLRSDDK